MTFQRMVQQLGSTRKTDGNGAGREFVPSASREDAVLTPAARRWRDYLAGPRLPPGPALAVAVLISLALWAGIIGMLYYILYR